MVYLQEISLYSIPDAMGGLGEAGQGAEGIEDDAIVTQFTLAEAVEERRALIGKFFGKQLVFHAAEEETIPLGGGQLIDKGALSIRLGAPLGAGGIEVMLEGLWVVSGEGRQAGAEPMAQGIEADRLLAL